MSLNAMPSCNAHLAFCCDIIIRSSVLWPQPLLFFSRFVTMPSPTWMFRHSPSLSSFSISHLRPKHGPSTKLAATAVTIKLQNYLSPCKTWGPFYSPHYPRLAISKRLEYLQQRPTLFRITAHSLLSVFVQSKSECVGCLRLFWTTLVCTFW